MPAQSGNSTVPEAASQRSEHACNAAGLPWRSDIAGSISRQRAVETSSRYSIYQTEREMQLAQRCRTSGASNHHGEHAVAAVQHERARG